MLASRSIGASSDSVVVLLHGTPGSARSWDAVADLLAPNHRVLIPDLLGFGSSPRPKGLLAEAQADALGSTLEAEGIGRASFVGYDFGGPIALTLYRRRPELFSSLALLATNTFPDTPIPFPLNTVTWPVLGGGMSRILFSKPALRMLLWRYGGSFIGEAASVRQILTSAFQNLDELYRDYPSVLRSVTVPTLVLWGDRDPFFPVDQARRTASLLQDVEFDVLSGAGHFLPEERPREVADAIRRLAKSA